MAYKNYKQVYAVQRKYKEQLLKVNPDLNDESGIYFLTREEDGFKYAYIGQAKHILQRLCSHMTGYQHIDLSLKKHGFYSEDNPLISSLANRLKKKNTAACVAGTLRA